MGTTPGGIPYPEGSDIPDVSYWLQQMAEALDTALRPKIQTGEVTISLGGANSATAAVVFPNPFPATPKVFASYGSVGNTVPRVFVGAGSVTPNGCTLLLATTDGSTHTGSRQVSWLAVLPL